MINLITLTLSKIIIPFFQVFLLSKKIETHLQTFYVIFTLTFLFPSKLVRPGNIRPNPFDWCSFVQDLPLILLKDLQNWKKVKKGLFWSTVTISSRTLQHHIFIYLCHNFIVSLKQQMYSKLLEWKQNVISFRLHFLVFSIKD